MKPYPNRINRFRKSAQALALGITLLILPGCGVELAMLGAAASAASQGSAVYKRGKLNASWLAPFRLVVTAGEVAFDDLGMQIIESEGDYDKGTWTILAINEDKNRATIKIDRKTDKLTEFQIDIGMFGKEPTARLLLKRMSLAINLGNEQVGTNEALPPPPPPSPKP